MVAAASSGMIASADSAEVVVREVTGSTGSVILMRGAETFSVQEGDTLREGDIVITRAKGAATIVYGDRCTRSLGALESVTIDQEMCDEVLAAIEEPAGIASEGGVSVESAVEVAADELAIEEAAGALPLLTPLLLSGGALGAATAAASTGDAAETPQASSN